MSPSLLPCWVCDKRSPKPASFKRPSENENGGRGGIRPLTEDKNCTFTSSCRRGQSHRWMTTLSLSTSWTICEGTPGIQGARHCDSSYRDKSISGVLGGVLCLPRTLGLLALLLQVYINVNHYFYKVVVLLSTVSKGQ